MIYASSMLCSRPIIVLINYDKGVYPYLNSQQTLLLGYLENNTLLIASVDWSNQD
jgi:hypothetical protein